MLTGSIYYRQLVADGRWFGFHALIAPVARPPKAQFRRIKRDDAHAVALVSAQTHQAALFVFTDDKKYMIAAGAFFHRHAAIGRLTQAGKVAFIRPRARAIPLRHDKAISFAQAHTNKAPTPSNFIGFPPRFLFAVVAAKFNQPAQDFRVVLRARYLTQAQVAFAFGNPRQFSLFRHFSHLQTKSPRNGGQKRKSLIFPASLILGVFTPNKKISHCFKTGYLLRSS